MAKRKGSKKKYDLINLLDRNLIGDGICDMISGVVGGPAGTNYGENISTMAITKVFSVPVLAAAAVIAMVVSFFTPLIQVIYGIPLAVIGGLEVYLFGAIAAQGHRHHDREEGGHVLLQEHRRHRLHHGYRHRRPVRLRGQHPLLRLQVPCIAGAAIFGILLNLLLNIGEKRKAAKEN